MKLLEKIIKQFKKTDPPAYVKKTSKKPMSKEEYDYYIKHCNPKRVKMDEVI